MSISRSTVDSVMPDGLAWLLKSHAMMTLLLLVRATYIWVFFFRHIPFVVNRTFNATPVERLQ